MENASTTLITVEELCAELMIGKNTAYKLLTSGKLKGFRIGRMWKIPRESLNRYLIEQTNIYIEILNSIRSRTFNSVFIYGTRQWSENIKWISFLIHIRMTSKSRCLESVYFNRVRNVAAIINMLA